MARVLTPDPQIFFFLQLHIYDLVLIAGRAIHRAPAGYIEVRVK